MNNEGQIAFSTPEPLSLGVFKHGLPSILQANLPKFLLTRRWYGHKQAELRSADIVDLVIEAVENDFYAFSTVQIDFADQAPVSYFVPLVATKRAVENEHRLAVLQAGGTPWSLIDAPADQGFQRWLLGHLAGKSSAQSVYDWTTTSELDRFLPKAVHGESELVTTEQSNSSIIFGQAIVFKIFRRIEEGNNPDIEIGRFLTTRTDFRNMPLLLGEWRTVDGAQSQRSIGIAQNFITSVGDGWNYALTTLAEGLPDGTSSWPFATDAAVLGRRTAQLHLALASRDDDPAFSPEPITEKDVQQWRERLLASIARTHQLLQDVVNVDERTNDLIAAFTAAVPAFEMRADGFERLIGLNKVRVHGDYHLGQTLKIADGDFAILDFEGEPQRTLAERSAKTSPLKDVAGMLRSFGYARGAAERELSDHPNRAARLSDLIAWERQTRQAFLEAYTSETTSQNATFLPSVAEDFREALDVWELDKALYEIVYELSNRPDWLWLPLSSTFRLI